MTAPMKPSEILIKAKALISDPNKWIQDVYAKDDQGKECDARDSRACYFCSVGALDRITEDVYSYTARSYLKEQMCASVPNFNDNNTHAVVMQAWDKAIALAQKEGM